MSRHEGVSCDSCLKSNFRGRRFKCLICYDYDLCASCYESGAVTTRHTADHPVQCILTRTDFDVYYSGESLSIADQPQSFTCPYCGRMGFTEGTLQEHVASEHVETVYEVICPICASMPGGEPNLVTDDFASHLTLEHRSGPRDLISFLDEPAAARHAATAASSAIRIRHPSSSAASAATAAASTVVGASERTNGGSGGRGGGPRPRRSNMPNMHFSSSGGLSPSARDSVDPIAELLSQLSGVRRNAAQNSTLQQLQMQLQLERQQVRVARQQLERLPRRQATAAATSLAAAGSASTAVTGNSTGTLASVFSSGSNNTSSTTAAVPASLSSLPVLKTTAGGSANAGGSTAGGSQTVQQQGDTSSANANANSLNNQSQSQFLLARYTEDTKTEEELQELEQERADRSLFVQELFLSTLATIDNLSLLPLSFMQEQQPPSLSLALLHPFAAPSSASTLSAAATAPPSNYSNSNSASSNVSHTTHTTNNATTNADARSLSSNAQPSSFSNPGHQSMNELGNCDTEVASNVVSSKTSSDNKRPVAKQPTHGPPGRGFARGRPSPSSPQQLQQQSTSPPQLIPAGMAVNRSNNNNSHVVGGSSPGNPSNRNPRPSVRKPARALDGRNQATEPPPPH